MVPNGADVFVDDTQVDFIDSFPAKDWKKQARVHKPDNALRSCAHNQKCFNELMDVRQQVLEYVYRLRASHPTGDRSHKYSMEHDSEGC